MPEVDAETVVSGLCFCGYLLFYLIQNNCFVDGNKRAGWTSAMYVLLGMGLTLDVSDDDAEQMCLRVAKGEVKHAEELVVWIADRLRYLTCSDGILTKSKITGGARSPKSGRKSTAFGCQEKSYRSPLTPSVHTQYSVAVLQENLLLTVTIIIAMLSCATCVQKVAAAPSSLQTNSLFRSILPASHSVQRFYRKRTISIPLKLEKIRILRHRYPGRGMGIYLAATLLGSPTDNTSLALRNNSQKVAR